MSNWIALITSLPTENATARMRAWRNLKASGAAVLRDGVYLMPEREPCRASLQSVAVDILAAGGTALVLGIEEPADAAFRDLFNRTDEYAALLADIAKTRDGLAAATAADALKLARKLRKTLGGLAEIDFFPGEAGKQADAALLDLELAARRALSPDEPQPVDQAIPSLALADYQNRTWATRRRPWIDRLASAWLIRRYIDPKATLLWLKAPGDCPATALGFDFDGAAFSHIGARVTFEVLLASFALETPALLRLGTLVHGLDVGGIQTPEAAGIESILTGWRDTAPDDDQLFSLASTLFDGLLTAFEKASTSA